MTRSKTKIEASSGNVFADLELPNAEEALTKAQLILRISEAIQQRKLTKARAAGLLEVDQSTLTALLGGKLDSFSTESLFRFLNALGQDVEIVVRPRERVAGRATTRVVHS